MHCATHIEKARRVSPLLTRMDAERERRAQQMAARLRPWLAKFSAQVIDETIKQAKPFFEVRKQDTDEDLRAELLAILESFGLQAYNEAGQDGARMGAGQWRVQPTKLNEFIRNKEIHLKNIMEETRGLVTSNVREIIADALQEVPRPSTGEIARRIRRTFAGPGQLGAMDSSAEDRGWVFSPERAMLIARTEMVQDYNTGIADGMEVAGVEFVKWLSYNDGKSGDREHGQMQGKVIRLGDYFTTPLGNRLRYPGDPSAPIKEIANCRCGIAPHKGPATQ